MQKRAVKGTSISYTCMRIENIFQADYENVAPWRGREDNAVDGACVQPIHQVTKTIIPVRFQSDIKALCDYAGVDELSSGMNIKMTLQDILTIIPKKRARTDSYRQLIQFLKDEMGVSLEIKSRKTNHYGTRQI